MEEYLLLSPLKQNIQTVNQMIKKFRLKYNPPNILLPDKA